MARLAGLPGFAARSELTMTMRSTCEASIASSTAAMFADSRAERSWLVEAPHAQPMAWLFALALWQPQLQVAPGHDPHLHGFELFDILISLKFIG
jgi:hypothetical protein